MSKKKGIDKLQEEYIEIKKGNSLISIAGSAGPIMTVDENGKKKRDYLHWKACFNGPKNTPYMYGLFILEMKFTEEYPYKAPEVQMRTPTYHPNISSTSGNICVEYLKKEWNPEVNDIVGIINTVFDLLSDPNPEDPYQSVFKTLDINIFKERANKMRSKYAGESQKYDWKNSWNKGWNNDEFK